MKEQPNFSYIKQMSGGDQEFEKQLFEILKKELPLEINEYHENLNKKDYTAAANNIHKIKHKIIILGLELSYKVANNHEENLKKQNTSLQQEFEDILQVMINFVEELN